MALQWEDCFFFFFLFFIPLFLKVNPVCGCRAALPIFSLNPHTEAVHPQIKLRLLPTLLADDTRTSIQQYTPAREKTFM